MRPDSAHGQSVLSGGREFRDKFADARTLPFRQIEEDAHRDCYLLLVEYY